MYDGSCAALLELGREFQVDGPATAKLRGPHRSVLVAETARSPRGVQPIGERRWRRPAMPNAALRYVSPHSALADLENFKPPRQPLRASAINMKRCESQGRGRRRGGLVGLLGGAASSPPHQLGSGGAPQHGPGRGGAPRKIWNLVQIKTSKVTPEIRNALNKRFLLYRLIYQWLHGDPARGCS